MEPSLVRGGGAIRGSGAVGEMPVARGEGDGRAGVVRAAVVGLPPAGAAVVRFGLSAGSVADDEAGSLEESEDTAASVRPPPRKARAVAAAARRRPLFQRPAEGSGRAGELASGLHGAAPGRNLGLGSE
jgi:hypothetical protein